MSSIPVNYSIWTISAKVNNTYASNFPFLNSLKILKCATNRDSLLLATLQYNINFKTCLAPLCVCWAGTLSFAYARMVRHEWHQCHQQGTIKQRKDWFWFALWIFRLKIIQNFRVFNLTLIIFFTGLNQGKYFQWIG